MTPSAYRVARVQKTLSRFENDIPLLNLRVKDLSSERQRSAHKFAASLIDQTRAELHRLLKEEQESRSVPEDAPCEPAD
jgi:hypothetical protein